MKIQAFGIAWVLGLALVGCGDEQSKLDRGVPVGTEEAAPASERDLDMTDEQRQHQIDEDESQREAEELQDGG